MYGWVHKCLKETIINLCGAEKWREICAKSGVEDREGMLEKTSYNDDSEYFAIIKATLELLPHVSEEDLYNLYGDYFMSYIRKNGYEHYLRTFGDSLFEVINNVNKMHGDLATSMSKMKVPDIHCEECEGEDCFLLYYSSPRGSQLKGMLLGIVRALGRTYFGVEVEIEDVVTPTSGQTLESDCMQTYYIWKVFQREMASSPPALPEKRREGITQFSAPKASRNATLSGSLAIGAAQFHLLSPCHVVFNDQFEVLQISNNMVHSTMLGNYQRDDAVGGQLWDLFRPHAEGVDDMSSMSWDSFRAAALALTGQHSVVFDDLNETSANGKPYSFVGKLIFLNDGEGNDHAAVFLCSPNVRSLDDMFDQKASVQDMKRTDACRLRMLQNEAHLRHFKDSSTEAEVKLNVEKLAAIKVQRDLDAKRRLVKYISHEIRTPLTIAKLGFQLMTSQLDKLEGLGGASSVSGQSSTLTSGGVFRDIDGICVSDGDQVVLDDRSQSPLSAKGSHHSETPTALSQPNVEAFHSLKKHDLMRIIAELRSLTADSEHTIQFATSIFDDLLSYEKLQSGSLDMAKSYVPCAMVEGVANEFGVEANYFNIDLKFETDVSARDQRDIMVRVDVPKLCQVIRNYMSNALKFTPKGGKVTVSMSFKRDKDYGGACNVTCESDSAAGNSLKSYAQCGTLHVGVRDTGVGIAKENQDLVFHELTQFSTSNDLQAGGGLGLGLYISRAIIEKHSGTVGLESEGLGHGSYFFFDIPAYCLSTQLVVDRSPVVTPPVSITPYSERGSVLKGRTVLICDDSSLCRKMLRKVLMSKECKNILEAKNGLEAVQMLEDRMQTSSACSHSNVLPPFDYIFMDNNMPILHGTEATRQIRQLGFANLIVGVTGNVTDDDIANFMRSGVDAVFRKPLDFPKLEQFLHHHDDLSSDSSDAKLTF